MHIISVPIIRSKADTGSKNGNQCRPHAKSQIKRLRLVFGGVMVSKPSPNLNFEHRKRFPIPWPKFMKILTLPEWPLSANERALALVIFSFADLETLTCYPPIDTVTRNAHVGRNTVSRTIRLLVKLHLLKVTKQRGEMGRFDRNHYDFNPLRTHIDKVAGCK